MPIKKILTSFIVVLFVFLLIFTVTVILNNAKNINNKSNTSPTLVTSDSIKSSSNNSNNSITSIARLARLKRSALPKREDIIASPSINFKGVSGRSNLPRRFCSNKRFTSKDSKDLDKFLIQPVIAYPKGQRNAAKKFKNLVLRDMRKADKFLFRESNNRRKFAWDLGGVCGKRYPDLVLFPLPRKASFYKRKDYGKAFTAITNKVSWKLKGFDKQRKILAIYAFNTRKSYRNGGIVGAGGGVKDKKKTRHNWNIGYPIDSVIFGDGYKHFASYQHREGTWFTLTHELFHSLGAVHPRAPNATRGEHCYDTNDIMCYNDGTGKSMRKICPGRVRLDCGKNDYFSIGKARSSWLRRHWNTADSPYLFGGYYRSLLNKNKTGSSNNTNENQNDNDIYTNPDMN